MYYSERELILIVYVGKETRKVF